MGHWVLSPKFIKKLSSSFDRIGNIVQQYYCNRRNVLVERLSKILFPKIVVIDLCINHRTSRGKDFCIAFPATIREG
jgi:hypothetical protein